MVEADRYRAGASAERSTLSTHNPEERYRVRPANNCSFYTSTDVLHREALTRELTFLVGFELEFTLLKGRKGTEVLDDHDWSTSSSIHPGEPAEILEAMVTALERGGIVVHSFHAEAGPGQYKIVTGPLQPSQAADALAFSRDVIRGTASGFQHRATFTPWIHGHQCM
jgi:glutamine synthetase